MLLATFLLLSFYGHSQTLFESRTIAPSGSSVQLSNTKKSTVQTNNASNDLYSKRYISSNFWTLIFQGDIQVQYELPKETEWSLIYLASLNPHAAYNDVTGSSGLFGGARWYFSGIIDGSKSFLQGMLGIHQINDWYLNLLLELGQRYPLTPKFYMDTSIILNRSYAETLPDPLVYLKINIGMTLDAPSVSFL